MWLSLRHKNKIFMIYKTWFIAIWKKEVMLPHPIFTSKVHMSEFESYKLRSKNKFVVMPFSCILICLRIHLKIRATIYALTKWICYPGCAWASLFPPTVTWKSHVNVIIYLSTQGAHERVCFPPRGRNQSHERELRERGGWRALPLQGCQRPRPRWPPGNSVFYLLLIQYT